MSDATVTSANHEAAHSHPADAVFIRTAVILAVITAIEIAWSYLPVWDGAHGLKSLFEIGGLLIMMMAKFTIVTNVFMHLKYDKPLLGGTFYFGFVIALLVYVAVLSTYEFWSSGAPGFTP